MIDYLAAATMDRVRPWEMLMALDRNGLPRPDRGARAGSASISAADRSRLLASSASPETVGRLLAEAFRSGRTVPFAELMSRVFTLASPLQQAEIVRMLLERLGEATVASMPDGEAVIDVARRARGRQDPVFSLRSGEISPDQVKRIARLAEWHDPAVVDRICYLCAEHAELTEALGEGTLTLVAALLDDEQRADPPIAPRA